MVTVILNSGMKNEINSCAIFLSTPVVLALIFKRIRVTGLLPHVRKVHAAEQRGNQWKVLVTKHSMLKGTKRQQSGQISQNIQN